MRTISVISFLLLGSLAVIGQSTDKTVASINARYADIAEKARLCETDDDQGEFGALVMTTLDVNARGHQWRAVGIYRPVYKFFYKGVENDEKRLYPDQLVFIKAERRVSARVYHEEYLFSDTGVLMFYRQKAEGDDSEPAERRVYFSGLNPIRVIEDGKKKDKLTPGEGKNIAVHQRTATKLVEFFKRTISL